MEKNQYLFSFYVDDIGKDKLRSFYVRNDKFIGLIGSRIVIYQLENRFREVQPFAIPHQIAKTYDPKT